MPKTHILLLQPTITLAKEDIHTFGLFPPLGLAYIAAVLDHENYAVRILDLLAEDFDCLTPVQGMVRRGLASKKIIKKLKSINPKIVGIANNFTTFSADAVWLATLVRKCLPKATIIMGGAHASVSFTDIFKSKSVDAIILGEAEYVFRDVVKAILAHDWKKARSIKGTVWRQDNNIINNGFAQPLENLDDLPIPAYHLLPMDKYIWQRNDNFAIVARRPIGHMITSRGCRFNCLFCSTVKHFKKFRARSPENVIDEIKFLIKKYGIREFHFHDDSFMSNPKRVAEICSLIINNKLNIRWQVSQGLNLALLEEELLVLMYQSGMYRVGFPIESGCQEILNFVRKPINLAKAKRLIKIANYLGLYCFGCFMIGFPQEKIQQIERTRKFILSSGLDYVKVSIVQPLAGSELYQDYVKLGLLAKKNTQGSTYYHTKYDTLYLKADRLNSLRQEIVRDFSRQRLKNVLSVYGFFRFVFPKINSFEKIVYYLKVARLALLGKVNS